MKSVPVLDKIEMKFFPPFFVSSLAKKTWQLIKIVKIKTAELGGRKNHELKTKIIDRISKEFRSGKFIKTDSHLLNRFLNSVQVNIYFPAAFAESKIRENFLCNEPRDDHPRDRGTRIPGQNE